MLAPNHPLREQVTPARRGRRHATRTQEPPVARHVSMTGAQRLQRVFRIDIEICATCGGPMKVLAAIEDPAVIKRILAPLASPKVGATSRAPTARPATTDTARLNGVGRRRSAGKEARSDPASADLPSRSIQLTDHARRMSPPHRDTFVRPARNSPRNFRCSPLRHSPQGSLRTPRGSLRPRTMPFIFPILSLTFSVCCP